MVRAILVGDGQLDLFPDLSVLLAYVEPYESETGLYKAYTEDGCRWSLTAETEKVNKLFANGDIKSTNAKIDSCDADVNDEIIEEVRNFIKRCGLDLKEIDLTSPFDIIKDNFGFSAE